MTPPASKTGEHLLIYEPRIEGHHLSWLRFITEDFLSAGLRLTLENTPHTTPDDFNQTFAQLSQRSLFVPIAARVGVVM